MDREWSQIVEELGRPSQHETIQERNDKLISCTKKYITLTVAEWNAKFANQGAEYEINPDELMSKISSPNITADMVPTVAESSYRHIHTEDIGQHKAYSDFMPPSDNERLLRQSDKFQMQELLFLSEQLGFINAQLSQLSEFKNKVAKLTVGENNKEDIKKYYNETLKMLQANIQKSIKDKKEPLYIEKLHGVYRKLIQIGATSEDPDFFIDSKSTKDIVLSMLDDYRRSWFVAKDRVSDSNDLSTQINNLNFSANPHPVIVRPLDGERRVHQELLSLLRSKRKIAVGKDAVLKRTGDSRYINTLDHARKIVLARCDAKTIDKVYFDELAELRDLILLLAQTNQLPAELKKVCYDAATKVGQAADSKVYYFAVIDFLTSVNYYLNAHKPDSISPELRKQLFLVRSRSEDIASLPARGYALKSILEDPEVEYMFFANRVINAVSTKNIPLDKRTRLVISQDVDLHAQDRSYQIISSLKEQAVSQFGADAEVRIPKAILTNNSSLEVKLQIVNTSGEVKSINFKFNPSGFSITYDKPDFRKLDKKAETPVQTKRSKPAEIMLPRDKVSSVAKSVRNNDLLISTISEYKDNTWFKAQSRKDNVRELYNSLNQENDDAKLLLALNKARLEAMKDDDNHDKHATFFKRNSEGSRYQVTLNALRKHIIDSTDPKSADTILSLEFADLRNILDVLSKRLSRNKNNFDELKTAVETCKEKLDNQQLDRAGHYKAAIDLVEALNKYHQSLDIIKITDIGIRNLVFLARQKCDDIGHYQRTTSAFDLPDIKNNPVINYHFLADQAAQSAIDNDEMSTYNGSALLVATADCSKEAQDVSYKIMAKLEQKLESFKLKMDINSVELDSDHQGCYALNMNFSVHETNGAVKEIAIRFTIDPARNSIRCDWPEVSDVVSEPIPTPEAGLSDKLLQHPTSNSPTVGKAAASLDEASSYLKQSQETRHEPITEPTSPSLIGSRSM